MNSTNMKSCRAKALEEARVALQLPAHENIVRTLSAWEEKGHLYILTELCEGNLRDYIAKVDVIPEEHIWFFLKDIAMVRVVLLDEVFIYNVCRD
jgi:serine/threonine protein kinase